jgi:hypothetical protein
MKIALASQYRLWMIALLPSTLGLGSAVLWLHSLNWPRTLDEGGLELRNHRKVKWHSITRIGVSRSYLDGHVSEIRIHYNGGTSRIPSNGLQNGQTVVRTILATFAQTDRARTHCVRRKATETARRNVTKLTQEFGMLPNTWANPRPGTSRMTELTEQRT